MLIILVLNKSKAGVVEVNNLKNARKLEKWENF